MKVLNIEGLPEHVVRALQNMVNALRQEFGTPKTAETRPTLLPTRPGGVIGNLSREEIYDDVV